MNNKFTENLFRLLSSENKNLFFSPASVASALSMATCGANGETRNVLLDFLNFNSVEEQNNHYKEFSSSLDKDILNVNAFWCDHLTLFKPLYVEIIKDIFGASVNNVDFTKQETVDMINDWCNRNTNGLIEKIVSEDIINGDTCAVITNAIYFKKNWDKPFEKYCQMPFNGLSKISEVEYMKRSGIFNHYEDDLIETASVKYDDETEMIFVLPKENLQDVENNLDLVFKSFDNMNKEDFDFIIPKFKFKTNYELAKSLKPLPVGLIFSSKSDFSNITDRKIVVSEIVHKAAIEVNEEGTEAAAATGMIFKCVNLVIKPSLVLDKPFLFFIRKSNNILFAGKIVDFE